jgi:hypothetical protein
MAVQGSDSFMISRGGVLYKTLASDILSYVEGQIGTSQYRVANIAARNGLDSGMSVGDRVMVDDATGDANANGGQSGWALYQWLSSGVWRRIADERSLDITVGGATNLAYSPGAANGVVTSDTGTDATIPAADGTNAGLLLPAQFVKLGHLAVSAATDLDAIRTASHAAVTLAGSVSTNPVTLTGQQLGFSIANLTSAP